MCVCMLAHMRACTYMYIYVYMCVLCVCIYIYICIYITTKLPNPLFLKCKLCLKIYVKNMHIKKMTLRITAKKL